MTPGWKLIPEAAGIFGIELIHQFDQILLEDRHQEGCDKDHVKMRKTIKKNGKQKRFGCLKIRDPQNPGEVPTTNGSYMIISYLLFLRGWA